MGWRLAGLSLLIPLPACSLLFNDYSQRFGAPDATTDVAEEDATTFDASNDAVPDVTHDGPREPPSDCGAAIPTGVPHSVLCPDGSMSCGTGASCCTDVNPVPTIAEMKCCPSGSCNAACVGGPMTDNYLTWLCDSQDDCGGATPFCCVPKGTFTLPNPMGFQPGCPVPVVMVGSTNPGLPACNQQCNPPDYLLCTTQSDCGPTKTFCTPVVIANKVFGLCLPGV